MSNRDMEEMYPGNFDARGNLLPTNEEAFPIMDVRQAVKEIDKEEDARLLLQAAQYLRMTDEEFKDRIDYFAGVGEGIIKEEEYAIKAEESRKAARREEGRRRAALA